jgi:hypothetical protein
MITAKEARDQTKRLVNDIEPTVQRYLAKIEEHIKAAIKLRDGGVNIPLNGFPEWEMCSDRIIQELTTLGYSAYINDSDDPITYLFVSWEHNNDLRSDYSSGLAQRLLASG